MWDRLNPRARLLTNHSVRPRPIIPLTAPVKSEDSSEAHGRTGKAIHNGRENLQEPGTSGTLKSLTEIHLLPACTSVVAAERLASWAEVCPAVLHDDSLDRAATNRA
jgi:hypothetical protein